MAVGFAQFAALRQNALDNRIFVAARQIQHAGAGDRRQEIVLPYDGSRDVVRGQRAKSAQPAVKNSKRCGLRDVAEEVLLS
jgi:hypothetical protein